MGSSKEVYVIKDEKGDYVSEFSFGQLNKKEKKWSFSSYTGICEGFRYYPDKKYAEKIKGQLEEKTRKLGINKAYNIAKIKYDTLTKGKYITNII